MSSPAQGFVEYYESHLSGFDILNYFQRQFSNQPEVKYKVEVDSSTATFVTNLCNAILGNLSTNKHFISAVTPKEARVLDFAKFYQLVKSAITSTERNENRIAQLILLLHMSSCEFHLNEFDEFFANADSVKLCTQNNFDYDVDLLLTSELSDAMPKLLNHEHLKEFSVNCVKATNSEDEFDGFDFGKLKLAYFTSNLDGLKAYSGVDTIYMSITELSKLFMKLDDKRSDYHKLVMLKLHQALLIIREMPNIIARHVKKEVDTSPYYCRKAGLMAEFKIFGSMIDWVESSKSANLNINYCCAFLEELESNRGLCFDHEKAKTIGDKNSVYNTGFTKCKDQYF